LSDLGNAQQALSWGDLVADPWRSENYHFADKVGCQDNFNNIKQTVDFV